MDELMAWATVGHRMGLRAAAMLGDPHGSAVFALPRDERLYVQWHGEPEGEFFAEAASGQYDGATRTAAQVWALAALGWAAPGEGWGSAAVRNWSRHWAAPVDIYAVVLLTVRTLREVFDANPHDLLEAL